MKLKRFGYILLVLITIGISGCKLPQFSMKSGGRGNNVEIPGKTLLVNYIESTASLASSNSSTLLTESIRDLMLNQTKFDLSADMNEADWIIEGQIVTYKVTPLGIQAGSEVAAQNRLTIGLKISCQYNRSGKNISEEDEKEIQKHEFDGASFQGYIDFDSNLDFSSVEEELMEELNGQLAQDIFEKAFGGNW